MSTTNDHPAFADLAARHAPYAAHLLGAAAEHARRIHAEEVTPEHLLYTLMTDEDCAAHRAVLGAFADPETIAGEVLALSPGILVVGSGRSVPFSVRGARTLERARDQAVERRADAVEPADLFAAGIAELEESARSRLDELGLALPLATCEPAGSAGEPVRPDGPLLGSFSAASMRVCGFASRIAVQLQRESITPAHVVFAALEADETLQEVTGLSSMGIRTALAGQDEDPTATPPRSMGPDADLRAFLGGFADGADSLAWLGGFLERGSAELRHLLAQQRISLETVARAQGVVRDPDGPGAP